MIDDLILSFAIVKYIEFQQIIKIYFVFYNLNY